MIQLLVTIATRNIRHNGTIIGNHSYKEYTSVVQLVTIGTRNIRHNELTSNYKATQHYYIQQTRCEVACLVNVTAANHGSN